jgi:hypothetical protein
MDAAAQRACEARLGEFQRHIRDLIVAHLAKHADLHIDTVRCTVTRGPAWDKDQLAQVASEICVGLAVEAGRAIASNVAIDSVPACLQSAVRSMGAGVAEVLEERMATEAGHG